ncbi:RNA polymerase sigma factor [Lacticaseibacillus absianus]|uniref:RNA polymerase sigma factor n=1 Tax=Lacticaseibacillus absianus TaxID=2729623 RepID=UPI0015C70DC2|nr:sigma-70 family RNA polymerase sigma factor [Lacticaseibacillus absianus]
MDDDEIVARLKAQDERAFDGLIDRYGAFIRQVIWHQVRSEAMRAYTEDIENRVYYKVWANAAQFDPARGQFKQWLGSLVKHQTIDYVRGLKGTLATLDIDNIALAAPEPAADVSLTQYFAVLSPTEKQVFELFFADGRTPEEISQQLKMRVAAVYKHLSRGRAKIRRWF